MNRWAMVVIPFATCALVAIAVFVVGAPEEPTAALLYGGATEGLSVQAWTLELTHGVDEAERPAAGGEVAVEVTRSGGQRSRWRGTTRGARAELRIQLPGPANGPLQVAVRDGLGELLARGRVFLARRDWLARARRSGGWLDGDRAGALHVDVAPGRGAFAVDFAEPLWVRVRHPATPCAGARVEIASEGADVSLAKGSGFGQSVDSIEALTNPDGWVGVYLRPRGFDVALTVIAHRGQDATGQWSGALPVVAGALDAERRGRRLTIRSSIPRSSAFFSIVSARGRWGGGELSLEPDAPGATGSIRVPSVALAESQLWAVVAPDPHLASSGAVGWPVGSELAVAMGEPPLAMTVADQLLLDGRPLVRAREVARQHKARVLAASFAAVAVTLMAVLLLTQTTGARHRLEHHLAEAGQSEEDVHRVTGRRYWIGLSVLAVFLIAVGYAMVALVAMARIG
jgi:hypothetical protein